MLSRVWSCALLGVEALPVCIETHTEPALPSFHLVGLPNSVVRESRTRVMSAIRNANFQFPRGRIVVNLAPAEIPKEGSAFDLPLAIGLIAAERTTDRTNLDEVAIVGELSLDGTVKPVRGALPAALSAIKEKKRALIVPADNAREAGVVENLDVYPVKTLREAAELVYGFDRGKPVRVDIASLFCNGSRPVPDLSDVKGQEGVKRALEVAAAGGHNILMIGPPGAGKTMMARRIPGILPPMTIEESLETTKVHSVGGKLRPGLSLVTERPFRAPHHTVSDVGLVGGGSNPMPGEISLSHNGVLFLDELPEFRRSALEAMRQPLEEGTVTISRARISVDYPARFMLVASMNPCPCGFLTDKDRECVCSASAIQRYKNRLSGPLIDRIDMHIEVAPVPFDKLARRGTSDESARILERVMGARKIQEIRFEGKSGMHCNAQMGPRQVRTHCRIDRASTRVMKAAVENLGLSARGFNRLLKVARTIADLAGHEHLTSRTVSEAIQYRTLDRRL